ncbi:MAG: hypothetical protein MI922_08060, partial [Bacteroidales bacterium]|nr:hypothetical protein [Bacteroidales bacterium]
GQDGFINTTLHTLTPFLWNVKNPILDSVLIILAAFILLTTIHALLKSKDLYDTKLIYSLFFIFGLCNILLQNWILGVNFPADRGGLYLILFFFAGLCFSIDYWKNRWLAYPFIAVTLIFFGLQINLTHIMIFDYEHLDKEILAKIPKQVKGIPPCTGMHRDWAVDNEMLKVRNLPLQSFQKAITPLDTIHDFIIMRPGIRPGINDLYHPLHTDNISGLSLYKRNKFLERTMIKDSILQIDGNNEYLNLYREELTKPLFLRCSGYLEDMSIFKHAILVLSADNSKEQKNIYYHIVSLNESCVIDNNGKIKFDVTFSTRKYKDADKVTLYFWNMKKDKHKGEFGIKVYEIQ